MKNPHSKNTAATVALAFLLASGGTLPIVRAAGEYATLSTFSGHAGSVIQVSGGNFLPNEAITVYGGQQLGSVSSSTKADGTFQVAYTIPQIASGTLPITVSGGTETASNSFYVQPFLPSITLSASSVTPFSVVGVSGTGFEAGETVNVALATATASVIADANGAFKGLNITVPNVAAGTQTVTATGATSAAVATGYEYINGFYASVYPSAAYLVPGQTLSFNGSGFAPAEEIDIYETTNGVHNRVAAFPANITGGFDSNGSVVISPSQAGQTLSYTISGATSHASGTLTVSIGTLNPQISFSDYYVLPNAPYSVSFTGFFSGEKVDLAQGTTKLGTVTADKDGNGTFKGLIFPSTSATSLTFTSTGEISGAMANGSISVGQYHPYASVDNSYATPGTQLMVSGGGFAAGEHISLTVGGVANAASAVADKYGNIAAVAVTMPKASDAMGNSSIIVNGQYGETPVTIALTVAPFLTQLAPSNYYVTPGSTFNLNGTGYAPNEQVTVLQGTTNLGTVKADKNGAFAFPVILPFGVTSVTYSATGAMSTIPASVVVGAAAFTPVAALSAYSGTGGSAITVSGSGYAPSELVDMTWDGTSIGAIRADKKGNFAVSGYVGYGMIGTKIFTATGELSGATSSASFSQVAFNATASLSNYYGTGGSPITVSGSGYAPSELVDMTWDGTSIGAIRTDSKGNFAVSGYVGYAKAGAKIFTATGETSGATSSATFTQAGFTPNAGLSAYYGAPGSPITVSGTGYAPSEMVDMTWDGTSIGAIRADKDGNFAVSGYVGYGKSGDKVFTATGETSGATASATFTQAAFSGTVFLSSYYGVGGSPITVSGTGYAPSEMVDMTWDGTSIGAIRTDSKGNFAVSGYVGYAPAGDKIFTATGRVSGGTSSATFTLAKSYVSLQLGAYAGAPGTAINFVGSGYMPGETIDVTTDRTTGNVYSFTADKNGSFNVSSYIVPAGFTKGNLTLTVTGEHSFTPQSITFYVTGL